MLLSRLKRTVLLDLRYDLAALAVEIAFIRLERTLQRKYREDQPREPAGQPGGGRFVSEDHDGETVRETVTEDGSRVLTLRIRSRSAESLDERHVVIAPDGLRTEFETEGLTQTIRDGDTGEIIARNTLTPAGAEPEAFVQDARGRRPILPGRVTRTMEALGILFGVLSARNDGSGTAVFAAPASEYAPSADPTMAPIWVGRVDQATLDQACPRNGEVQALADSAAASVRASGNYMSPQDFGNQVHARIATNVRSRHDPNFVAEVSYVLNDDRNPIPYGAKGSIRLDVLERSTPGTVCVYDHKTGEAGLDARRASSFAAIVQNRFPETQRIIVIEVRPR